MSERRSQVVRGSSGRFRSARPAERAVRTRSTSARPKANGGGGRQSVRAAAERDTGTRVARTAAGRAAPRRAAAGTGTARTRAAGKSPARSTPRVRSTAAARKPRAAGHRATRTAAARPRAQAPRRAAPRRRAAGRSRAQPAPYAVKLLKQEHRALLEGAAQFDKAVQQEKHQIAERFCKLLALHIQLEEELLYPQAHDALGSDSQRIATAQIEHAVMRDLASQIEDMDEVDELYEARMQVLTGMLHAHIYEEETEIFPRLARTSLDLNTLGEQLAHRKQELSGDEELVIAYEYEEDEPLVSRSARARHGGGARSRGVLIHSGRR
jgi:hemerythrin-like domain-containing protein